MEKQCIYCGEPFSGRSDKKFCSSHCRTLHNNNLNRDETNYIRNINNLLRKNRRILQDLYNKKQKCLLHYEELTYRGFQFGYFTHQYKDEGGKNVSFVYDVGYIQEADGMYRLLSKDDVMHPILN